MGLSSSELTFLQAQSALGAATAVNKLVGIGSRTGVASERRTPNHIQRQSDSDSACVSDDGSAYGVIDAAAIERAELDQVRAYESAAASMENLREEERAAAEARWREHCAQVMHAHENGINTIATPSHVPSKAHDLLYGGHKNEKEKVYDVLGVSKNEVAFFEKQKQKV